MTLFPISVFAPRIIYTIGREQPSPEMVRAAAWVAQETNERMGRQSGWNCHNVAPVEVVEVPYPISPHFKARSGPGGLNEYEYRMDFVIGAAPGGTGWTYTDPTRGASAVSALSLEIAMALPAATTKSQRRLIAARSTYICAHEYAHMVYGLSHASRDPRGPCRDDHITCYMRMNTWMRLPAGTGFDAHEQAIIDNLPWLHKATGPSAAQLERLAAWARTLIPKPKPTPELDFSAFGTPAFSRAPANARRLITKYFRAEDWENAAAIGELESHWDTLAVNDTLGQTDLPSGWLPELSIGWFAINVDVHRQYSVAQMKNPELNVKAAAEIKDVEGWGAWLYSARAVGIV